ncbi:hypothetical protein EDD95_8153 [Streptomyces sp. CEV 2-1]|uniref:hypothetical protein n=1 Tax=Streptomyces sp. CEV 2-1 TaxID=2485153 RepID=UPI000FBDA663|nr:hypothetical protein [Streptomyces sp. CEV 2-1]ROQ65290.1 hypothetical protein EDD95_8153 [Streptomyces sp. CEV 2-1]
MRHNARKATAETAIRRDDFVLYRDPEKFWTGQADHTFVCRVIRAWMDGSYDLVAVATHLPVLRVTGAYMRLLPAADAMHDIDFAPLGEPDPAAMTPAAVAWLSQQSATATQRPELPTQR